MTVVAKPSERPGNDMEKTLKSLLLLLFAAMLLANVAVAQENKPAFTADDRKLIESHYNRLIGALAPGTINRTPLPFGVENALVVGSRIPMQVERDLTPLPLKLEMELSRLGNDFSRYRLGRHVVLVRKADYTLVDILRNVALNERAK